MSTTQLVQRSGGQAGMIPQVGRLSFCDECGDRTHEAIYSHEGQWSQGPVFAVVCPRDGLTGYYTLEVVILPMMDGWSL